MLTQREKKILEFLKDKEYCVAKLISKNVSASEHTIRNDITSINSKLNQVAFISSKTNLGFRLEIYNNDLLNHIMQDNEEKIPSSPQERISYIIKLFLNENRYIKTEEIANMLYQSTSTVSNDLKEVRKYLHQFHLTLESKPKYGMTLCGNEKNLRELESDLLYKSKNLYEDQTQFIIAQILRDSTERYEFQISEFAFNNLVIHLQIAIDRIRKDKFINFPNEYYKDLLDTLEFTIAKDIVSKIEKQFSIKIPQNECIYITMHLLGKRLQNDKENLIIPQRFSNIIQKQLIELSHEYNIDFDSDLNLQLALSLHLIPLSYRLKYDLRMENPLLESIKINYAHAYIIAKSLAHGLSLEFNKELPPSEIGYLALHINLSIEKKLLNVNKKNIILVCATGRGTAKLLEHQYRQKFDSYINKLICCDLSNLKYQDFTNIDFIFTTVPIAFSVPVPVIETNFILNPSDVTRIKTDMNSVTSIASYFPKELFFSNMELQTQEDVISFMIEEASKLFNLPYNFKQLIWQREKLFTTAFDNKVALPHPYIHCTEDTFVCTVLLRKPILWGDKLVQMVFLVSLSQKENPNIHIFYGKLSKLLINESLLKQFYQKANYESLIRILDEIEI